MLPDVTTSVQVQYVQSTDAFQRGNLGSQNLFEASPNKRQWRLPSESHSYNTLESKYIIVDSYPAWLSKAKLKLKRLANLQDNWDGYGSSAPKENISESALAFLESLEYEALKEPFIAPIPQGGVQFEWMYNNRELEIEFLQPDKIGCLKSENAEPISEERFSTSDYNSIHSLFEWLKSHV